MYKCFLIYTNVFLIYTNVFLICIYVYIGLYFIFLVLIDGLRYSDSSFRLSLSPSNQNKDIHTCQSNNSNNKKKIFGGDPIWSYDVKEESRQQSLYSQNVNNTKSIIMKKLKKENIENIMISNNNNSNDNNTYPHVISNKLPSHHPLSSFVIDFLIFKMLYFLFMCLLSIFDISLKFPSLFDFGWNKDRRILKNSLAGSNLLILFGSFLWIIFILKVLFYVDY